MEAYRDQYATLFNAGNDVVVIGISADADTTLAAWARESDFPMLFASDVGDEAARRYGSVDVARKLDTRNLFVVSPAARLGYVMVSFTVLSADAYTGLAAAVDRGAGVPDSVHE